MQGRRQDADTQSNFSDNKISARGGAGRNNASQGGMGTNAANESKDAITGRIIHTVNMMKEVLQGNLGLRETI